MNLVRAQYATPADYWLWEATTLLNKARNELAHQIEPSNIANLVRDFLKKVDLDSSEFKSKEEELHMAIAMVASLIYELYSDNT